jgi:hypothetical protein
MLGPALVRFPNEAERLGRILLSYGELEFLLAHLLGLVIEDQDSALRMVFRITGETNRISAIDAIMRPGLARLGMGARYADLKGAASHCTSIRNQFAHSHWADHHQAGLFYTNLQEAAKGTQSFEYWWRHVDLPLLDSHVDFFEYALNICFHLEHELKAARDAKLRGHPFPMPPKRSLPPLHNSPEEHVPLWLSPELQQRHIDRFRGRAKPGQKPEAQTRAKRPVKLSSQQKRALKKDAAS